MRLRLSFGVAAVVTLVAAGCNLDPVKSCEQNSDCSGGGRCDSSTQTCVTTTCTPECGFGDYCVSATATCETAHTGSKVTAPVADALIGKSAKVHVRLTPAQAESHEDPAKVTVTATSLDVGGNQEVSLSMVSEGEYEGTWNPTGSGRYSLAVADAAYPGDAVEVKVDQTGPTFTVQVDPHPTRPDVGTTTYTDPGMPNAFRRDETATVTVRSTDTDVDPSSVRVSVTGTGAAFDAGVATQVSSGCDAGYCGTVDVPLWGPEMKAYHAVFHATTSGADTFGNASEGTPSSSFEVTRLKWSFGTPDGLAFGASPAVGRDGTVYVGTAVTSPAFAGRLYALSRDGQPKWAVDAGAIEVSPSVGADGGGFEDVFVATSSGASSGDLWALNSANGNVVSSCLGTNRPAAGLAVAAATMGGVASDSATTADSLPSLQMIRPIGTGTATRCPTIPVASASAAPGNVVISGSRYLVPSGSQPQIQYADFTDTGWVNADAGTVGGVPGTLAISGSRLFYSQTPGLGSADLDLSAHAEFTNGGTLGVTFGPVLSSNSTGFLGEAGGLVKIDTSNLPASTMLAAGKGAKTTNLLGEGNWLYVSAASGFQAWHQDGGSPEWQVADAGFSTASVPLSIDCTRDSDGTALPRPGVVYVQTNASELTAIVVDSHGIDTTAPWPKYQHDPRNTGNADTPMPEFACP